MFAFSRSVKARSVWMGSMSVETHTRSMYIHSAATAVTPTITNRRGEGARWVFLRRGHFREEPHPVPQHDPVYVRRRIAPLRQHLRNLLEVRDRVQVLR